MSTTTTGSALVNILERTGLFSGDQIAQVLGNDDTRLLSITERVVHEGYATEPAFLRAIGETLGLAYIDLRKAVIEPDVLEQLPTKAAFLYNVMPTAVEGRSLTVATSDPFNPGLTDALRLASGHRIRLALSPSDEIANASKKYYGVGAETVDQMMQGDDRIEVAASDTLLKSDIDEADSEASIVKFVNQIIWEAHKEKSTDIHLEPMEHRLRIRYRVDGVLIETPLPAQLARFQAAIISRIKVMANMDIAEKRLPQDGRIGLRIQGEEIDIRVSTMPTVYGESVSLRLLTRGTEFIGLAELGLYERDQKIIDDIIHRPNGIVLVTGPTGSGKSTSLYAYLHEINNVDRRILTVEDPIEYEMEGINQVHVREDIGLSFAHALRTFLRQDPDIIMVGEIRDFETAETAIRAALTGHLVFSTLHTNDAAGAVSRLIDMGVEPFLVASSVKAIVAQRLVRRLCPSCRVPDERDHEYLTSIGFPLERMSEGTIFEAAGCDECRNTGYRGRTGIYEILALNERIEPLVVQRKSATVIKAEAIADGMRALRYDGWEKVLQGVTTIDEVLRVTEDET